MKKILYLVILTSTINNACAMQCWPPAAGSPRAVSPAAEAASNSADDNWQLSDLLPSMPGVVTTVLNRLDQEFGAGAAERQAHQDAMELHAGVVRKALLQGTLEDAISRAAKESSSNRFISLLLGMQHLKIQPDAASKSIIEQRLGALRLAEKQETLELLEQRLTEEKKKHELRKQYLPKSQLSDDEDYNDLHKFVDMSLETIETKKEK
ncbi:MAG: hypothetical protein AB7F19_04450 [Candidatus Babeliales bacterium]